MGLMTRNGLNYLARCLGEDRPDWDMQTIIGALHRIDRGRGRNTSYNTIMLACAMVAGDLTSEPSTMADNGPHWAVAADLLRTDLTSGRRWANQRSREAIEDARNQQHLKADPKTAAAYAQAARAALTNKTLEPQAG